MAPLMVEFFCPFTAKRNRILRLRLRVAALGSRFAIRSGESYGGGFENVVQRTMVREQRKPGKRHQMPARKSLPGGL